VFRGWVVKVLCLPPSRSEWTEHDFLREWGRRSYSASLFFSQQKQPLALPFLPSTSLFFDQDSLMCHPPEAFVLGASQASGGGKSGYDFCLSLSLFRLALDTHGKPDRWFLDRSRFVRFPKFLRIIDAPSPPPPNHSLF